MSSLAKPFIKWAGGKRSLLKELLPRMPKNYNNYHEPFIGGGALFFALNPNTATISDVNIDLITTYLVVKNNPLELIDLLRVHKSKHSEEYYYDVRKQEPTNSLDIAARFIYLNKTCFNGLHRVNGRGKFNVPIGSYKDPNIVDEEGIITCSKALQIVDIKNQDFSSIEANAGDFVYLDPPYHPINETSFTKYSKLDFNKDDQIKLFEKCKELDDNNVYFMLSNSDSDFIKELYKEFNIEIISAPRNINSNGNGRERVNEVLIRNYN